MEGERETSIPESEPERLLELSEQLLRKRDYSGCRKYALQAQQSDPHLAVANQILAVADVLIASQTRIHNNNHHRLNYYSILQLNPLSQDRELIKKHFKKLLFLLNPMNNGFTFAKEAFTLVCEAWSVLSHPTKKPEYDDGVEKYYQQHQRREEVSKEDCEGEVKCGNDDGDGSFWTACPYCYYVYEYERVYLDCCLKCQNCRRGFHGAVLPSPPPVVPGKDQYYICLGFFPLGFSGNGEREVREKNGSPGGNVGGDGDGSAEISDESKDSSGELESAMKDNEKPMNENSQKSQEEAKNGDQRSDQGGFVVMQGSEKTEVANRANKQRMMRRKTVARNTKKIKGTGIRGGRIETTAAAGEGSVDLNVEARKEGEEPRIGSIRGMGRGSGGGFVIGGVEYFEGDDDILVGLPIVDDGGNGKVQASS